MKSTTISLAALMSLALACGCSNQAPPKSEVSVTQNQSTQVTVESEGQKRSDATFQSSHSDSQGSRASVQVSASKTDANGKTSDYHRAAKVSSDDSTLGFTVDDKQILVTGSNVTREFQCHGQDVRVSGNLNHLTFRGPINGLSVVGTDNSINSEQTDTIAVEGKNNRIRYQGQKADVRDGGSQNQVSHAPNP